MSAAKQLRLLPVPKPLTEHLGAEFFRGIPKVPGVYRMFDATGALLYVGQSANLRDRLNSYRHVHPDRDSRKTVRLVHRVRRIEWEVCDSPVSAVLRENELLRTLRPPVQSNERVSARVLVHRRGRGQRLVGALAHA